MQNVNTARERMHAPGKRARAVRETPARRLNPLTLIFLQSVLCALLLTGFAMAEVAWLVAIPAALLGSAVMLVIIAGVLARFTQDGR